MDEYVHYGSFPSDMQRKIMVAQVDGLTVLGMVERTIDKMVNHRDTITCRVSKSCVKCPRVAGCVRKSVENQIVER